MSPPSIDEFINTAREFCAFAEDERDVVPADLWKVRDLLLRLIYHIPAIENAPHDADHEGIGPDEATYLKALKRFREFHFDIYEFVFDPHNLESKNEPSMGMLSDDLADIYRDLAEGLDNADRGHVGDACSDWAFSYRSHWARHAVNALTAIEIHRTDSCERTLQITGNDSL